MKKYIDLWEYAGKILEQVGTAALVTAKADGEVNTMTIGWGTLGVEWGKPIFTVFVRQSRHTKKLLDQNGEFTINVPLKGTDRKAILGFCGSKSGRDTDKIAELGLELVDSSVVDVPGIRQLPLTLECRVLSQKTQNIPMLPENLLSRYYPKGVDSSNPGSNEDFHIAYYGEIVNAYLITD